MAAALDAPWMAVSVDLTGETSQGPAAQQIANHFRLAERLGAETLTIAGQRITDTILDFARSRNVTKIFIGKTNQPRWRRLLYGSAVDELLEQSREIDVYVIHGAEESSTPMSRQTSPQPVNLIPYASSGAIIILAGIAASGLRSLRLADAEANTVMLFLAAVALAAFRFGRGPAILASVLAVLVFDFFFVPPYRTFAVADAQYIVTFGVMLAIGLVISTLTSRLRAQVLSTRLRERRTSALYELGKQLSSLYGKVFLAGAAGEKMSELLSGEVSIFLERSSADAKSTGLEIIYGHENAIARHDVSLPAAQWVADHSQIAGAGTNTLPNAIALFLPLTGSQRTLGAVAIRVSQPETLLTPDQRRFLEACANQLALALERDQLAIEAADARIEAEAEHVRSSLLSSVSHDLKTPLASIAGASSSLLEAPGLDEATRRQLLETVADEAARLNRLLENILQMSKLDAGVAASNMQWHVLEEVIGSALHRTRRELAEHEVAVDLPADMPLLWLDGLLMEQVFVNLLENAARYTPVGTKVRVSASIDSRFVRISVADNGPGFPKGAENRIFDKFFRATPSADGGRGSGLGLAICRAIATNHGGEINAQNRSSGGAEFVLRLPIRKDSPQIPLDVPDRT
jgi:two-component system sensor histidine kinase KdpD